MTEHASLRRHAARLQTRQRTLDTLSGGQKELAKRINAFTTTLQHIDQGILMVDPNGIVVVYNDRVAEMLGLPADLLASRPRFTDLVQYQWQVDEFRQTGETLRASLLPGTDVSPDLYERDRPNGSTLEVRTRRLADGAMVRTFTDITERKRAQTLIERATLQDELTGLPTRLALHRALEQSLATGDSGQRQLVYLNLDRFRLLNDARGHEIGDRVLIEAARRLLEVCPPEDMVSRVGGHQFAILHTASEPDLPDRVLRSLAKPHVIDGGRLSITASIGVVTPEPGDTATSLLRHADIALSRAKDAGRGQVSHYTPSMRAARQERFHLEQSLREAVGTDAFRLAYQPIVAVQGGEIIGFEALLRWTDHARGDVPPSVFIPVAEATGLIVPLGRSVLEWACAEAASWPTKRTIAVNLSPAQFQGDDIVETVRDVLARSGLPPARLELEVTEGMLLEDTGAVLDTIKALRRIGVRLTLDDFGAGHTSLSYLRRFPFEKMKIDGSFVRALGHDPASDAIVEAILLLGRRLAMDVVAEGVETELQLERLRALECTLVQGFLTGRPMPAEQARLL